MGFKRVTIKRVCTLTKQPATVQLTTFRPDGETVKLDAAGVLVNNPFGLRLVCNESPYRHGVYEVTESETGGTLASSDSPAHVIYSVNSRIDQVGVDVYRATVERAIARQRELAQ